MLCPERAYEPNGKCWHYRLIHVRPGIAAFLGVSVVHFRTKDRGLWHDDSVVGCHTWESLIHGEIKVGDYELNRVSCGSSTIIRSLDIWYRHLLDDIVSRKNVPE